MGNMLKFITLMDMMEMCSRRTTKILHRWFSSHLTLTIHFCHYFHMLVKGNGERQSKENTLYCGKKYIHIYRLLDACNSLY